MGGYIEWTLPLAIYGDNHPKALLDTYGYPDPWTDYEKMKRTGVMVIDRTAEKVIKQARHLIPYLPEEYEINPTEYRFNVKNALNQEREYKIYYYIVPAMD